MSAIDEMLPLRFPNKGMSASGTMYSIPQSVWDSMPQTFYGEQCYHTACGRFTLEKTGKRWQINAKLQEVTTGMIDYQWRDWLAVAGLDLVEFKTRGGAINALAGELDYCVESDAVAAIVV